MIFIETIGVLKTKLHLNPNPALYKHKNPEGQLSDGRSC